MKNYPKTCIYSTLKPKGGFYRHQGRGGPGDKPWPEAARAAAVWPRKRGYGRVFAAIQWPRARRFEPRAILSVSCQFLCPVLCLQPLILTESAS